MTVEDMLTEIRKYFPRRTDPVKETKRLEKMDQVISNIVPKKELHRSLDLQVKLTPEGYQNKYYPRSVKMHDNAYAKKGDGSNDSVPMRTLSCVPKIQCNSKRGHVYYATGVNVICMKQKVLRLKEGGDADSIIVWECTDPRVTSSDLEVQLAASDGGDNEVYLAVSTSTNLLLLNSKTGEVMKTVETKVQCMRWSSSSSSSSTLAVIDTNGGITLYDHQLEMLKEKLDANASCVSWRGEGNYEVESLNRLAIGTMLGGVDEYDTSQQDLQPVASHLAQAVIQADEYVVDKRTVHVHWIEEETVVAIHLALEENFDNEDRGVQYDACQYYVHMLSLNDGQWQHMSGVGSFDFNSNFIDGPATGEPTAVAMLEAQKIKLKPSMSTVYIPNLRVVHFAYPHTYDGADINEGTPLLAYRHPNLDKDDDTGGWEMCYNSPARIEVDDESETDKKATIALGGCCLSMSLDSNMPMLLHLVSVCTQHREEETEEKKEEVAFPRKTLRYYVTTTKVASRWMNSSDHFESLVLPCVAALKGYPVAEEKEED